MDLSDLLEPERIRCQCAIQSKKRTLQTLAELLGESLRTADKAANGKHASQNPSKEGGKSNGSVLKGKKSRTTDKDDEAVETLSDMEILDALISRERLGSTGLGHGVALPHSRLSRIDKPIAAFVTLDKGVDFESADDEPVDLVFGLLVPEHCNDEHLQILAKLAKRFSDDNLRSTLRSFDDGERLYAHLSSLASTAD